MADNAQRLLIFIVFFPIFGAIANGFFLRRVPRFLNILVGTMAIAIPFAMACILFFGVLSKDSHPIQFDFFPWIALQLSNGSQFIVPFSLTLDKLSGVFLLVITGIGSLIHLYAGEYMHHEKGVYRFFAYLNLFVFSMLCLVLGSNMLVTFLGWEGVGVCSYLLIGYWYEDEKNSAAGMKAFIANRVGDLGFLIVMFACVKMFGTLDYSRLTQAILALPPEWFFDNATIVTLMGLSLLLAVTGKSAQLPLYVWLPDAMAGPTPVSALIHAATMVTSGIYLMTRMSFLLVHSSIVMTVIASVGAATALFAATIGLVQNDIKKVLAYSTVSQLGFMVMACGVGAFQYGVAHVVTHAFFKALLFLGAGSVIHAMHHEQDIRKMGGLIKKLPITGWTFVVGTLAIIGFPGFAGFFSKDEILFAAWTGPFGSPVFWCVGALAAACTSFYMVRLTYLVFFGACRADAHTQEHLHENPWPMTLPLVVLAIFSVIGGWISIPHAIGSLWGHTEENWITQWLEPILSPAQAVLSSFAHHGGGHGDSLLEWALMASSVGIMFVMLFGALFIYSKGPQGGAPIAKVFGRFYALLLDKWRVDELYSAVIIRPLKALGEFCFRTGDRFLIEGIVNDGPRVLGFLSTVASDAQGGLLRSYVKFIFIGILLIAIILFTV